MNCELRTTFYILHTTLSPLSSLLGTCYAALCIIWKQTNHNKIHGMKLDNQTFAHIYRWYERTTDPTVGLGIWHNNFNRRKIYYQNIEHLKWALNGNWQSPNIIDIQFSNSKRSNLISTYWMVGWLDGYLVGLVFSSVQKVYFERKMPRIYRCSQSINN